MTSRQSLNLSFKILLTIQTLMMNFKKALRLKSETTLQAKTFITHQEKIKVNYKVWNNN